MDGSVYVSYQCLSVYDFLQESYIRTSCEIFFINKYWPSREQAPLGAEPDLCFKFCKMLYAATEGIICIHNSEFWLFS